MESIVNLIDIMLIFACGLMVSIVALWGLDIANDVSPNEGGYQDIGRIYEDPETGKLYVVSPAEDEASETGETGDVPSPNSQSGG
jgi:hypothetical protein